MQKTGPGASPAQPRHCGDVGKHPPIHPSPSVSSQFVSLPKNNTKPPLLHHLLALARASQCNNFPAKSPRQRSTRPSLALHPIARLTPLTAVTTSPLNWEKNLCAFDFLHPWGPWLAGGARKPRQDPGTVPRPTSSGEEDAPTAKVLGRLPSPGKGGRK